MSLSVGPIESYVPDTAWFDLTQYSDLGTEERVSINLSESDLWLIDSSDLYLPYDYDVKVAFLNEGAGYQSPVSLSASGSTTGDVVLFDNLSGVDSVLPSANAPLEVGDWVQVSTIEGGTQLNFSVTPNGVRNPGATPLSTDYTLNPVNESNPDSPFYWVAYADPEATKPVILLGYEDIVGPNSDNDYNDGILAVDVGQENFDAIFTQSNLGQDPTVNLADAEAVPFDPQSSLGLLVLGGMVGVRGWLRRRR